jgi:hypothetical protein
MNKARAVAGAFVALSLSTTVALAATPHSPAPADAAAVSTLAQRDAAVGGPNDNHGDAVSALARGTHGAPDTTAPTTTSTTVTGTTQGVHGAAVSAVAKNQAAVGGPNHNHGGAVSDIANGTHGASATPGKSAAKSQAGTHPTAH